MEYSFLKETFQNKKTSKKDIQQMDLTFVYDIKSRLKGRTNIPFKSLQKVSGLRRSNEMLRHFLSLIVMVFRITLYLCYSLKLDKTVKLKWFDPPFPSRFIYPYTCQGHAFNVMKYDGENSAGNVEKHTKLVQNW